MTIKTDNSAVIAKLQAENETLRKEVEQYQFFRDCISYTKIENDTLKAEKEALVNFARSIIFPSGEYLTGDLEGDYVESMGA
jgi:hypothetical protein